ncbi:hypothetical protein G1K66_06705 [Tenacibaculum finnmarkense]|uniref:hypothetical protein n=1 Tax=Tenacibaculum finnmarkense TaxID=2781243 RepID=UPI00187B9EFF|nr:hypothetical protein [Tenacibaculum finnmarkense]MBE7634273.1 hypothetical protein [Tenacibaculum finnmarkense genomovar ulcerans]MCD8430221.1 hypothetical protein [Tenacibaculum finnmarkense genomovar ulcerans]MCG8812957.1 hypothetical protein [Tenacibaculum finnmarkense]
MLVNSFALLVNYFGLSPKFEFGNSYRNIDEVFLLTDSNEQDILNVSSGTYYMDGTSQMYQNRHPHHFWPFTKFYEAPTRIILKWHIDTRFRGIFADFDHTEFLVYTLLIFGIVILRKIW